MVVTSEALQSQWLESTFERRCFSKQTCRAYVATEIDGGLTSLPDSDLLIGDSESQTVRLGHLKIQSLFTFVHCLFQR